MVSVNADSDDDDGISTASMRPVRQFQTVDTDYGIGNNADTDDDGTALQTTQMRFHWMLRSRRY